MLKSMTNVKTLIDSGATFNGMSLKVARELKCEITHYPDKPLKIILGAEENKIVERNIAKIEVRVPNLPVYSTLCYILPIPDNCDILLGLPWLRNVNPNIDWVNDVVSLRSHKNTPKLRIINEEAIINDKVNAFNNNLNKMNCVNNDILNSIKVEKEVIKTDKINSLKINNLNKNDEIKYLNMMLSMNKDDDILYGTKAIDMNQVEDELKCDVEFCCFINPKESDVSQKAERILTTDWESFKDNPAYKLICEYKDIFRTELPNEAPKDTTLRAEIQHEINVTDTKPIALKQYPLSPAQREALSKWTDGMLRVGLIRVSKSPYNFPIFAIKKADGFRFVHDYRLLNAITLTPKIPIPLKDDIFNRMSGAKIFSCLDLLNGYYQMRIRESDIPLTAFSTPSGHYEYIVTPQGLCGAPASFNKLVQAIFKDVEDVCSAYFDDAYVFTKGSIDDHLLALRRVFEKCRNEQVYLKLAKCILCADEIPCLGDFIGTNGVRMDPDKIKIIKEWPVPINRNQMKRFLGTVIYNHRFIPKFGKLVAPLHELTKGKSKFCKVKLSKSQLEAFNGLKDALCNPPLLHLPDFSREFCIRMDASDFAVGGMLYQVADDGKENTIAYCGKKLSSAEINYGIREKELYAVIFAMRKWRIYLLDRPFLVDTDHHSLETLLTQTTCSRRLARWLDLISEFRPQFRWIPGDTNHVADAVSRRPDFVQGSRVDLRVLLKGIIARMDASSTEKLYMHITELSIADSCRALYEKDSRFGPIVRYFRGKISSGEGEERIVVEPNTPIVSNRENNFIYRNYYFDNKNKLLWFLPLNEKKERLCIPKDDRLIERILREKHDVYTSGHPGISKTLSSLQQEFYWKNMAKDVQRYVTSCEICQRTKARQCKPPGKLIPLDIPNNRWKDVTMDFIVCLPESDGYNSILVIVDRLTKRSVFIAVKMNDTAEKIAETFIKYYYKDHGLPSSIVCDRDTKFMSKFWKELMRLYGTSLKPSTAHKSSTDGQTERTNRFIEDYIRCYCSSKQSEWYLKLPLCEFAYNSRLHESIGMSPFEADLGYIPRAPIDVIIDQLRPDVRNSDATKFVHLQKTNLKVAQDSMNEAQERMKLYFDKNRKDQEFKINDLVLLNSANLTTLHIGSGKNAKRKFTHRWIGPFKVLEKLKYNNYKISIPDTLKLHPVFHTSKLKPYIKDYSKSRENNIGSVILAEGDEGYLVEKIMNVRGRGKNKKYLIKWIGYADSENSWEPAHSFAHLPDLIKEFENTRKKSK